MNMVYYFRTGASTQTFASPRVLDDTSGSSTQSLTLKCPTLIKEIQ